MLEQSNAGSLANLKWMRRPSTPTPLVTPLAALFHLGAELGGIKVGVARSLHGLLAVAPRVPPADVGYPLAAVGHHLLNLRGVEAAPAQGLTLDHFSAQLERFLRDRGCA